MDIVTITDRKYKETFVYGADFSLWKVEILIYKMVWPGIKN